MNYPCLIPKQLCKTPVHVELEQEGVTKYGGKLPKVIIDTKCNYQDGAKTELTAEKKLITINGCALFPGDIAPELSVISAGTITVYGEVRKIAKGTKARNPDNTVNYTKLEVE